MATSNDFVDYFFQKEGDTFISQLLKLREEYTAQCSQAISSMSPATRKDYNDFTAKLLDPDKILPPITRAENFDFDKALASVFEGLDLDVTDTLEMIAKYYGFIANLQNHWKGLELERPTVIETSIQLMATLESMVYPLFLKLTNYIGTIATPGQACGASGRNSAESSPEAMMSRLHKLTEALTMEIATIGSSGLVTLGQCPTSSKDSMLTDSAKLGAQSRSAKNCISWALQAVAPSLQFYYLQTKNCELATQTPQQPQQQGCCKCACPCVKADPCSNQAQLPLKTKSESVVKIQESSASVMSAQECDEDEECEDEESRMETRDAQSQAQDDRFVTTATKNVQADDDEDSLASGDETGETGESESQDQIGKKVPEDAQAFQDATRDNAEQQMENDFVTYFFKKNGIKYVAILSQTKKKYEERCKALLTASPEWKKSALAYVETVHDVRKISPATGDVPGLEDIDFHSLLINTVKDFAIDIRDKLTLIKSYQEYTKGMLRHWRYRIDNSKPLSPDAVTDIGIQMMATTMALVYPVFIRIAEFLRKLSKSGVGNNKYTPEGLASKLHVLVELNARQMRAIGLSCLAVIETMPKISDQELEKQRTLMESQMTLAKNSVSWAMKSISPLLLLYFINLMKSNNPQNSETSVSERSPKKEASLMSQQSATSVSSRQESRKSMRGSGGGGDKLAKAKKFYKAPSASKNLVFYFYAKEGQKYSSMLTHLRTQYEGLVHTAMDNADQSVKDQVPDFVTKYHEARKATVPKEDVDIADIMFKEAVAKIFSGIEIDIQDNLATIVKYFEFAKNVETHWNYRIKKGLELDQDAVLEMSIEMMGTTVALSYPIFIKIAEYVVKVLKNHALANAHTPADLIQRFKKFIALLTTELAAIGMTCTGIMGKLPNANRAEVAARATKLANETKTADGAISWAMKAVFPIFMLYFLQYSNNSSNA